MSFSVEVTEWAGQQRASECKKKGNEYFQNLLPTPFFKWMTDRRERNRY